MVELAFGKRVASSWALALLPSCVHACQPECLSDVWASHIQAPVRVTVSPWSLPVQACLGLPSNCFGAGYVCHMGVSRLRISS